MPGEGRKLNYRIIGFSFPQRQTGGTYKIEIAQGSYNNADVFKKNIILSFYGVYNKIIGEVPSFGKQYTWRSVFTGIDSVRTAGPLHHFSTGIIADADTNIARMRIVKHAEQSKDGYVFSDDARTLYDMNGNPVWFLPESKELPGSNTASKGEKKVLKYCDFKVTNNATIIFARVSNENERFYEVNYNGDILWKSPETIKVKKDSLKNNHQELLRFSNGHYGSYCYTNNNCHHEFTRLTNGHYMSLENQYTWLKLPGVPNIDSLTDQNYTGDIIEDSNHIFYQRVEFGSLIEYDADVNVVWSWNSSSYFLGSDVYSHITKAGVFDIDDIHENAFYFDEKSKIIYVSCRNVSRIIKIAYPSGGIVKVYGKIYEPDAPNYDNIFFYHQHNCRLTSEGYLSVFNNNDKNGLPTLLVMEEPVNEKDTLKKVWEYQCTIDEMDTIENRPSFGSRGSAIELPDHTMLACITSEKFTKIFIVNKDKKVLWSALPERWNANNNKWDAIFEYIASMVRNKEELERLIWK